jgi:uncharacterized membrane protein YeaQ/YmgE (transglycosylase-associated protein family)
MIFLRSQARSRGSKTGATRSRRSVMNLEMFATWVVVGLLTGWLAGFVMKDGGYGRIWDVVLGLAGSGAASSCASALGAPSEAGRVGMAVVAFVGSAFMIVLQRKIWPAQVAHA